jgi:hypothetical protein
MIHPELAELKTWERSEYAAGYGGRLSAIPKSEAVHYRWRVGWDDADTELLESVRHQKVLAEGGEEAFAATWGVLCDAGGDARENGVPLDRARTQPWKEGWIDADMKLRLILEGKV